MIAQIKDNYYYYGKPVEQIFITFDKIGKRNEFIDCLIDKPKELDNIFKLRKQKSKKRSKNCKKQIFTRHRRSFAYGNINEFSFNLSQTNV